MALLSRAIQRIFGQTGGVDEFGEIGSRAAGNPQTTKDLTDIQSRTQYLLGWFQTTIRQTLPDGTNADLPASEDINSLFFLITSQLAYLFQNGIPEWLDSVDQRYYAGISFVQVDGAVYQALQGDDGANINAQRNPLTEPTWWRLVWSTAATAFYRNITGATTINLQAETPPKVIEVTAGTPLTLTLNGSVAPSGAALVVENSTPNPVTLTGSSGITGTLPGNQTLLAVSDNNSMVSIAFGMDQSVRTTDDVTFNDVTATGDLGVTGAANVGSLSVGSTITASSLNTGQGDNDLFPMNQAVTTTSNVTFSGLTLTSSTEGSTIVPNQGEFVFPAGFYAVDTNSMRLEVFIDSAWQDFGTDNNFIFSDGTNFRINNSVTAPVTFTWRRFS